MKIIYLEKENQPKIDEPLSCALGFFDGLHLGHRALLDEVFKTAKEKGLKSALMTFDIHPLEVLKNRKMPCISSFDDRFTILEELGLDYLLVIHFTLDVAHIEPQDFINEYIIESSIKHVVCGYDYRYGNKNSGDTSLLLQQDAFETSVIPAIMYDDKEKVSSTLVRRFIGEGKMNEVSCLLKHPYVITGEVVHGKQIGRTIGFPTANIAYDNYLLPKNGVYAVLVSYNNQKYKGMANIGRNPTLQSLNHISLEINIFNFDQDIYNEILKVEFIDFIREECSFDNREQLIQQLHHDKQEIIELLKHL